MMRFDVVKTIRVPVPEPRRVALANGASARSLERWIVAPGDFMGVVFTADAVAEIEENLWRIQVLKLPLLEWELNPEFDLTVLDPSRAKRPGGVKMVCEDALRLEPASASASAFAAAAAAADASPRVGCPPGSTRWRSGATSTASCTSREGEGASAEGARCEGRPPCARTYA